MFLRNWCDWVLHNFDSGTGLQLDFESIVFDTRRSWLSNASLGLRYSDLGERYFAGIL